MLLYHDSLAQTEGKIYGLYVQSADEKLKSLGSKHHHGNKTSGQQIRGSKSSLASNTESINQQQTQTNKTQPPPTPTPSIESSQLETVADIHRSEPSLNESVNITGTDTPDDVNMADRRPQRAGRNDNKNQVTQDAKRRSRSEGRSKGRNSSNKKDGNSTKGRSGSYSKEPVDQQSRHSLYMYNEPQSDEGGFPDIKTSSSDSEETLQKKWIRNPNMVKQAGKKEKRKSLGNNLENGYHGRPNYLDLQGNKENVDRGSQKDKFKRLEEMRNKRVDLMVTSDEELNSPEFRISRLRQRALQGAKLSSKLPERLDEFDLQKIHLERLAADIHQNKENESSSTSEQITLRPIGPGQGSFSSQYIQGNVNKHPADTRFTQDHHSNQNINIQTSNKVGQGQGPYRKIPKQETNFSNYNPQPTDVNYYQGKPQPMTYYQGKPNQGPNGEFTWNFQNNNLQQSGYYGNQDNNSNVKSNFNDSKPYQEIPVKKLIEKGRTKRKSHSDDSLDELIESNIQYLESEMESGKLKKISASQPRMFPTQQSDIYNKVEKRRSTSLDSTKAPRESAFQNEVKLRLQIPSSKEQQSDTHSIQSSQYDRLSYSTSESSTPPSAYTLPPSQEYIFQNSVPKVERKFQSASHSPYLPRRSTAELSNDMSKSDSQLNWGESGMNYANTFRTPNYFPEQNPNYYQSQKFPHSNQIPNIMSLSASAVEGGMFSDVDYDIEVTDRIKKWEKFMKKKSTPPTSTESKSPVPLTTIMESEGGIPDSWKPQAPPSVVSSISVTVTKSVAHQPQPQRQTATAPVQMEPKVQSAETNAHRLFRVVQQPKIEQENMRTTYEPVNIQKRAKVIRRSSSKESDGDKGQGDVIEENTTKVWPPTPKNMEVEEVKQSRLSRFEEELSELQEIKSESVRDLRRKFNSDASGNESTDVTENTTPLISTPLRQRRQYKFMGNTASNIDIQNPVHVEKVSSIKIQKSQSLPRTNIHSSSQTGTNSEVWSPKLESGQGPVSIERVKARTLQTIPFHEDPFWKQIEQMTSFDDLIAAQNVDGTETFVVRNSQAFQFPVQELSQFDRSQEFSPPDRSQELSPPVSQIRSCTSYAPTIVTSTRPVQTSSTTFQPKPKVFHTPTIQPLKLAVAAKSSIEALDEVLDDIRSSLQKKTPAPQRNQAVDSSASSSSIQSPNVPKNIVRNIPIEKMKQNNIQTNTGKNVSQKYFDQQRNLMAAQQQKQTNNPQQNVQWIYPTYQQVAHSQMKTQPHTGQQGINQMHHNSQIPNQVHPNSQIPNQVHPSLQIQSQVHQTSQVPNQMHRSSQIPNQVHQIPFTQNPSHPNWKGQNVYQTSNQQNPNINQSNQFNQNINQSNQNMTFYQNNQQIPINPDITQFPYIINGNYQLDPSVLSERLMNTGLAFDQQSETDDTLSQKSVASSFAETEKQFNQSIEDLQNLARDVEDKLSQIKCKIVDADENRLDSILSALRKFAPTEPVKTPPNIHTKEEQDRQRAKLNEALTELDRIYYGLHLDDPKLSEPTMDSMSHSQTLPSHRQHIPPAQIRRNKSDSGFGHFQEDSAAQIDHQTQREFDDITKSFQTLLDEVSKDETPSKPSQHAAEIETTIESFLDEFRKNSDNTADKNISQKFESKLKDAKKATKPNTCRDVQKSEVFTVSSGSFSALVGVKNKKNENNQQKTNFRNTQTNTVSNYRGPVTVKSKTATDFAQKSKPASGFKQKLKTKSNSEPKVVSSTANIKLVSPQREIKVIKTSGSESEDVSDSHIVRKAKRNVNLAHRKSMPACMIQRTVETQTLEPSSPPVAVLRKNFQSKDRQSREGSESSESSAESRRARRKTITKGIALLMEFFSSSEDERREKSKLDHSTSAPDLRYVGCEKMTKSTSDNDKFKSKGKHSKQKHGTKTKNRSSYIKFDNVDDKIDDFYVTSTTSDDNVQSTHGSKPPKHPKRKQSATSPDKVEEDKIVKNAEEENSSNVERFNQTDCVIRRKKREDSEEQERPHSFHELLAAFETNPLKMKKLRKCSSAEAMLQDTTPINKIFSSDPDLRKDSEFNSGESAGVKMEQEVKDTAV
ncbi:uncharacterized protein LOC134694557 [Mytilus trossulus]|uniref:uncharacterized protein LOC134694557 n=1 Tax=Mytilus trossulus TaxID=6551 RepID=UPI003007DD40